MTEQERRPDDQLSDVLSRLIEASIKAGMGVSQAEEIYDSVAGRLVELEDHDARDVLKQVRRCLVG